MQEFNCVFTSLDAYTPEVTPKKQRRKVRALNELDATGKIRRELFRQRRRIHFVLEITLIPRPSYAL